MSQWELFSVDHGTDGAAYQLLSEHPTARTAFEAIQELPGGFYVVCPAGEQPDDWRALYRTQDGTVYQAWGSGGRSALEQVAS